MKYKIAIVVMLVAASVFSGIYMTDNEATEETRLEINIIEKEAPKEIELVKNLEKKPTTQTTYIKSKPVVREEANNDFVEPYS
jgi:hypothetical protein